jgi:hypothetical protein
MTVREWLRANHYAEIDALIARAIATHKANGSKERRSWAVVLCGGKDGAPLEVAGIEFPVLAAVQEAYGKPVTANAIRKSPTEVFLQPRVTGRWKKRRRKLPVKTKGPAVNASRKVTRPRAS